VVDNAGTLDVARALALARAMQALVDGWRYVLGPLAAELVGLLEEAQAEGAALVVSLNAERARRGRS
jgi:hypothetical protein